jgi:gluconolactonase
MPKVSFQVLFPSLALGCLGAVFGCDNAGDAVPSGSAGMSTATAGQAGAATAVAGTAGQVSGGSGGSPGSGGGGAGQAQGGSAPGAGTNAGGMAGSTGAAGAAGAAGAGGSGSVTPGKGASGQAVCAGLSGFVDPTTGIGSVKEVAAPQGSFFAFVEGPVWVATTKQLLFSDNAGSPERIWSLDPTNMMLTKAFEDSGSNGLAVDSNDQVIVTDQKNHAIYRWDSATKMKVGGNIATGSFKPNDVVVRSDGGIYFSDPDSGLYYIAPGTSEAKKASTKVNRPNGLVLTLDEKALLVGDVGNQSVSKFVLGADGSVIDATTPFGQTMGTTADGMCEDCAGNVYVSTQTGVEIFDSTGKHLGSVPTGEASNCTFGGADRKTMFVTSRALLKVVPMANPGLPD